MPFAMETGSRAGILPRLETVSRVCYFYRAVK